MLENWIESIIIVLILPIRLGCNQHVWRNCLTEFAHFQQYFGGLCQCRFPQCIHCNVYRTFNETKIKLKSLLFFGQIFLIHKSQKKSRMQKRKQKKQNQTKLVSVVICLFEWSAVGGAISWKTSSIHCGVQLLNKTVMQTSSSTECCRFWKRFHFFD